MLTLGGATLHALVLEPRGAVFSAVAVNLQPPYNPSVGVSKLMVVLPTAAVPTPGAPEGTPASAKRIVVGLSEGSAATAQSLNPLARWGAAGPFTVTPGGG